MIRYYFFGCVKFWEFMKLCNLMSEYMYINKEKELRGVNFFIDFLNFLIRFRFYLWVFVFIIFIVVISVCGFI